MRILAAGSFGMVFASACGSTRHPFAGAAADGGQEPDGTGAASSGSASHSGSASQSGSSGFGNLFGDASPSDGPMTMDPQTCAEAGQAHSYIACDYWPTVVANPGWDIFDFAVVLPNAGQSTPSVTVTRPSGTNQTATVPP